MTTQRLPASLTPLDTALARLREHLAVISPCQMALVDALGCVAAGTPPLPALPAHAKAAVDGWAFRANDLVGASSYAPLPLVGAPHWVEVGDVLPQGCDCVLDVGLVETSGPLYHVLGDAIPGQGVRRVGGDIADGSVVARAGHPLRPLDLMLARAANLQTVAVRRPRVGLIDHAAVDRSNTTSQTIADLVRAEGAEVRPCTFDTLNTNACDLILSIGGTGVGQSDRAVQTLSQRGTLLAHGLAMKPGRTAATGVVDGVPIIALPGAPDQAIAVWWALARPALDQLSGRVPRPVDTLPLARKIASGIGIAEIVLLRAIDETWLPLAIGDFSLDQIARADAWCIVPAGSEGSAAGMPLAASLMRDC